MVRIIGDVHGKVGEYLKRIKNIDESIQLGDFGFSRSHRTHIRNADSASHKVLFGNHDDYGFSGMDHSLGDYGIHTTKEGHKIFFIRGAYSIDKHIRLQSGPNKTWREREELTTEQGYEVVDLITKEKPDIIISHDCPYSLYHKYVSHHIGNPSKTATLLDGVFNAHKPKLWVHGHHHMNRYTVVEGTKFICLDELSYIDLFPESNQYSLDGDNGLYEY